MHHTWPEFGPGDPFYRIVRNQDPHADVWWGQARLQTFIVSTSRRRNIYFAVYVQRLILVEFALFCSNIEASDKLTILTHFHAHQRICRHHQETTFSFEAIAMNFEVSEPGSFHPRVLRHNHRSGLIDRPFEVQEELMNKQYR